MKRTALKIGAAVLAILCLLFSAAGCASNVERDDSYGEKLDAAVENSLKASVYFIKETKNDGKLTYTRRINVLPAVAGHDSDPVYKDEANGIYEDLRISVNINDFDNTHTYLRCGMSNGANKGDESAEYRFIRKTDKDDKTLSATYKPAEPNAYYASEEFREYRLETLIAELTGFHYADMDFDFEDAEQKTVGHVATLIFKPTAEYLARYEQENGKKSMFDGASRVLIEITYDRIANVTVYRQAAIEGTEMSVEEEAYKLEIAYLGPKINDIPVYNATEQDENKKTVPVWTLEA